MANGIRIGDVVRSSVKVPEFDKHLKKAGGHIGRNVAEITLKMKTIVRKPVLIEILMLVFNCLSIIFFFLCTYECYKGITVLLFYINLGANLIKMFTKYEFKLGMFVANYLGYNKWCIAIVMSTVLLVDQSGVKVWILNSDIEVDPLVL